MQKIRFVSVIAVIAAAVAIPFQVVGFVSAGHDSHTVAFYPFTGYENGMRWTVPEGNSALNDATKYYSVDVSNFTNHVAGADCPVRLYMRLSGYVTVTNETPGRYLFANKNAKWPLVSDFMGIQAVGMNSKVSCIDIPSFGKMMAEKAKTTGAFTLELFVKPIEGCTGIAFYFAIDGKNATVQIPQNDINNMRILMSYDGKNIYKDFAADVRDSKWHHIAVVYSQPDASVNGTTSLYYDYKLIGSLEMGCNEEKNGDLRLCASATWPGLFSALRVSDKALTTDGMLRVSDDIKGVRDDSDTIGFYPLNDKVAGFAFNSTNCDPETETKKDTIWTDAFSSVAENAGYNCSTTDVHLVVRHTDGMSPNVAFYSTNDVPARYIFDGVGSTTPLCELEASLCSLGKAKAGSPNTSDWIGLYGLPKDLYDADGFTLEFFAKFLSVPTMVFAYFDLGPSERNRILLQKHSDKGLKAVFQYKADNVSGQVLTESRMTYPDIETLDDGKWHHVAIVCDGAKLRLFCDYTLAGDAIDFSKGTPAINYNHEFRLGNGAQWAHFSCVRATAKPLDPSGFLYASDNEDGILARADWSWRLDGAVGGALTEADAIADAIDETQYLLKDSHGFRGVPKGEGSISFEDPFFPGLRVVSDVEGKRNRAAARMSGAYFSTLPSGPLCAPGLVCTVEAFVDADAPATGAATVFGAESVANAPAWILTVDSDGALNLAYAMQDGTVATNAVMAGFTGSAHHVALVVDIPNRSFAVYVDYEERLSLSADNIGHPLVTDGVHFVVAGGCGGSVLSGSIDEVRLAHRILESGSFLRIKRKGTAIVLR